MKNIIFFISIICLLSVQVFAYELDMSVDEEIQKKYNSSKLNYEVLPNLPKVNTTNQQKTKIETNVPKTQPTYSVSVPNITPVTKANGKKISSGTKFVTKSNQIISDTIRIGTNVSFTTTSPVYTKNKTIPQGSKLNGIVVDSHTPQITGNGGLVVIKIISLALDGKTYSVDGKITKSNYKKVFINNIKGKHQYWAGVEKQITRGENFYSKTKSASSKMSNIPIIEYLSPLPKLFGAVGFGVNAILSPVCGIFSKGGSLSIPAGSQFEIKLTKDAFVN